MVIFMTVSGRTIKLMALENTLKLMVPSMKDTGKRTSNMETVWKHGQMMLDMKVNMFKEKRKVYLELTKNL
jgi:hypothetical protein